MTECMSWRTSATPNSESEENVSVVWISSNFRPAPTARKASEASTENPSALFQFEVCRPKNECGKPLYQITGPMIAANMAMMNGLIAKFTVSATWNDGSTLSSSV